jgi:hypothetical protein
VSTTWYFSASILRPIEDSRLFKDELSIVGEHQSNRLGRHCVGKAFVVPLFIFSLSSILSNSGLGFLTSHTFIRFYTLRCKQPS